MMMPFSTEKASAGSPSMFHCRTATGSAKILAREHSGVAFRERLLSASNQPPMTCARRQVHASANSSTAVRLLFRAWWAGDNRTLWTESKHEYKRVTTGYLIWGFPGSCGKHRMPLACTLRPSAGKTEHGQWTSV
eukprot:4711458-Pleurochrysis_carterae.AAC.3